jgi:inner membrane protein involved in colicin E2 resistance
MKDLIGLNEFTMIISLLGSQASWDLPSFLGSFCLWQERLQEQELEACTLVLLLGTRHNQKFELNHRLWLQNRQLHKCCLQQSLYR